MVMTIWAMLLVAAWFNFQCRPVNRMANKTVSDKANNSRANSSATSTVANDNIIKSSNSTPALVQHSTTIRSGCLPVTIMHEAHVAV